MATEPSTPADGSHGRGSFSRVSGAEHLPASTIAALVELDAAVDAMVNHMRRPEARDARLGALRTRPRVRLDAEPRDG